MIGFLKSVVKHVIKFNAIKNVVVIRNNINKDQSNSNQSASRTDIIYHHNQKRYKQNEIDLNKDEFELNYVDMNIERQKEIYEKS